MEDLNDIQLSDLFPAGFDIDPVKIEEERKWTILTDQIMAGNVIPVIGQNILIDNEVNLYQTLIDSIAKLCQIETHPQTFSQLVYDDKFIQKFKNRDNIYGILNNIFQLKKFEPSRTLKRLLSIKQFPFVITTTFDPIVENTMREVWKERNVKVLAFSNNPATTNVPNKGDIAKKSDIYNPTLYYMFGKVDKNPHRFVVTDHDMLSFCKSWLTEGFRPKVLSEVISNKYLLVLGGNYSDWLFRFIWYSMKISLESNPSGMMVDNDVEDSLIDFLNRTNTFIQKDPEKVIVEIEHRLSERMEDFNRTKFDHPRMNTDVFISYSRSNKEIAKTLYETLTAKGLNVWYDMKNLSTGADFMEQIQDAIKTTKYFVALLSNHISEEVNDYHVYRKEWDYAIEQAIGLGREFILPVCEENFDMYNPNIKLPNRLKSHNAFFYKPDMDFSEIADDIMNKVNLL